jgi:hypothetical protein
MTNEIDVIELPHSDWTAQYKHIGHSGIHLSRLLSTKTSSNCVAKIYTIVQLLYFQFRKEPSGEESSIESRKSRPLGV